MQIGIGTTQLRSKLNLEFLKIFEHSVKESVLIHSCDSYPNTNIYFEIGKKKKLPQPKIITKILINKNPLKKIINITKEIDHYMFKFNTSKLQYLQICNNPHKNFFNQLLLKNILSKNKNKFEKVVLDCFFSYSKNILNLIEDKTYSGIVTTLNLFQSGASPDLLNKIKTLNKEIIIISPFASGKLKFLYNNLNNDEKKFITSLKKKYNQELEAINLMYLKSLYNVKYIILGTKNFNRFKTLISATNFNRFLTVDEIHKISKIQKPFH